MTGDEDDSEAGNALVEFVYLAVLLMVPLVYVLLSVFQVQRSAFGVTEAARQAGRAYVRADTADQGEARGDEAARLALEDQGVHTTVTPTYACLEGPCLTPGSRVRVTVTYRVQLPVLGRVFGRSGGTIPVTGTHTEVVDTFAAR